jgi:DHA1 family bicyclomycin/chloramphenicol resistance-like MFS transporter
MPQVTRLSTDSGAFTGLLAALLALVSLSVDTTLPAMPQMQADFGATPAEAQLTLTTFLLGVAAGQLVCGPLSDRVGRRPVFLGALAVFIAACAACALAQSIASLAAWRFVVGAAAVVGPVLSRAVVRDLHAGAKAAKLMSSMMVLFGASPILTPLVGGFLVEAAGWRSIHWFAAAYGAALMAIVARVLPETAPAERPPFSAAQIVRNFGLLLSHPAYRGPMLVSCASQCGIYAFVTNSSFVVVSVLGYSPWQYAGLFSFVMFGHIIGAQLGSRMVARQGMRRILALGAVFGFAGGASMALLAWAGVEGFWALSLPMLLYLTSAGLVIPTAQAAALTPFPKIAGAASSLQLMIQLLLGASLGVVIAAAFDGTTRPMAYAIGACGVALIVLERLASRKG